MKKIITTVISWDDLFLAEGREVPADGTVTLAYNGTTVELDLTDKNRSELEERLAGYLKAGRRSDASGRRTHALGSTRAANQAMRDWADAQVAMNPGLARDYDYISPGSRAAMKVNPKARPIYYHRDRLRRDYAAHLRRAGG